MSCLSELAVSVSDAPTHRPTPTRFFYPFQDVCGQTHLKTTAHNRCPGAAKSTKTRALNADAPPHTATTIHNAAQRWRFVASRILSKSASEQAVIPTALRPRPKLRLPPRETPPAVQGQWRLVFFESLLLVRRGGSSVLRAHGLQSKTKRTQHSPSTCFVKAASRFLFNPRGYFLGCP